MKVLVLSHMYPNPVNWHAGIFVHNQCKALIQAGIEVQVACPIPNFPLYPKWKGDRGLPRSTTHEGVRVHYIPTWMFPGGIGFSTYGYWYEQALRPALAEIRRDFPFDLLHCHTVFPDGNAGVRMKDKFQVPIVSTIHGSDIMLYPQQSKRIRQQTKATLAQSDLVVTVSKRLQREATKMCPEAQIETIYNGFERTQFSPSDQDAARKALGLPLDKKICLFIGNLYPVKGLTYLLQAFAKFQRQPNDVQLVMVGAGKLKQALQAEAKQLKIELQVSWMGRQPYEQIPQWIHSSDALVLSSLSEGLPSILLESMACGKPMIATDVGGIAEVLQDGKTGILVPAKQPDALAAALTQLFLDNPAKLKQMGDQAHAASHAYTWEENARQLITSYKKLP